MIGSKHRIHRALVAPMHRAGWKLATLVAVLAVGATSAVAGVIVPERTERFAATFDARAVGDPSITSCPELGPGGQKLEGSYRGTMTFGGEEYAFNFTTLEALVDRSAGLGSAEGNWQLSDRRTGVVVGRGELIAAVTGDPPGEAEPPEPDLGLHGLLVGSLEPPDPDMPARLLVANFSASLGDGGTFPHLKGAVGDPSGPASNPAALVPAVKC